MSTYALESVLKVVLGQKDNGNISFLISGELFLYAFTTQLQLMWLLGPAKRAADLKRN
jgi:hypothetical protein